MNDKKLSSNYFIAAAHWLASGFAIPMLLVYGFGIPLSLMIGDRMPLVFVVSISFIQLVGIWLGVLFSSKYIASRYIVGNKVRVVSIATLYLIFIGVAYRVFDYVNNPGLDFARTIDWVTFAVIALLFYVLSNKYIVNTANVPPQTQAGA